MRLLAKPHKQGCMPWPGVWCSGTGWVELYQVTCYLFMYLVARLRQYQVKDQSIAIVDCTCDLVHITETLRYSSTCAVVVVRSYYG